MITSDTVTAGTTKNVTLVDATNRSAKHTEITITGRTTGTVTIKIKTVDGDQFVLPSGENQIDLTAEQTLIIDGVAIQAVQFDDTANSGAALTVKISKEGA